MDPCRTTIALLAGIAFTAAAYAEDEASIMERMEAEEEELIPPDAEQEFEEWRESRRDDSGSLFEGFGEGDDDSDDWRSDSSEWDTAVPDVTGPGVEFGSDFNRATSAEYYGFNHLDPSAGMSESAAAAATDFAEGGDEPVRHTPASSVIRDFETYSGHEAPADGSGGSNDLDLIADGPLADFDPFDFSDRTATRGTPAGAEPGESRFERRVPGLYPEISEPDTGEAETFEPREEADLNPAYDASPDYLSR